MNKKDIITLILVGLLGIATLFLIVETCKVPSLLGNKIIHSDQKNSSEQSEDGNRVEKWEWIQNQGKLHKISSNKVNTILKELKHRFPDKLDRLKALAILRIGTPYKLGCLGEEAEPDSDPLFRLDVTDCTAFVLTNTALLHSQNLKEAKQMMKLVNYRTGEINFKNRLHFTIDRNEVSPFFKDITISVGEEDIEKEKVVLNKIRKDGTRIIDIDWEKRIVVNYIPSEKLTKSLLSSAPKTCGVALIKREMFEEGLDVVHEGILIDDQNLIHASSEKGQVVKEDFLNYYFEKPEKPKFDGIIVFEIK